MIPVITDANAISDEQRAFLDWHCKVLAPQVKKILASSSIPLKISNLLRKNKDYSIIFSCMQSGLWTCVRGGFDSALGCRIGKNVGPPRNLGYDELRLDDFDDVYYQHKGTEALIDTITESNKKLKMCIEDLEDNTKDNLRRYIQTYLNMLHIAAFCPPTYLDTSWNLQRVQKLQLDIKKFSKKLQPILQRLNE